MPDTYQVEITASTESAYEAVQYLTFVQYEVINTNNRMSRIVVLPEIEVIGTHEKGGDVTQRDRESNRMGNSEKQTVTTSIIIFIRIGHHLKCRKSQVIIKD